VRALWPAVAVAGVLGLTGCSAPAWLTAREGADKPAALVDFKPAAVVRVLWQGGVGSAGDSVFFHAVAGDGVYAAAADGQLARFDAASGKQSGRVETGRKLSGGVGASANDTWTGPVGRCSRPLRESVQESIAIVRRGRRMATGTAPRFIFNNKNNTLGIIGHRS